MRKAGIRRRRQPVLPSFPISETECEPVNVARLVRVGARAAGRLGGLPPPAIWPKRVERFTQYLLTVETSNEPTQFASVFTHFDFPTMAGSAGEFSPPGLIDVVVHPETVGLCEDGLTQLASAIPASLLLGGRRIADAEPDESAVLPVYSGHKLGGRPYLLRAEDELIEGWTMARAKGFVHVLQLGFPAEEGDDPLDVDWPFATGMFHLLGRPPFHDADWAWFWELD